MKEKIIALLNHCYYKSKDEVAEEILKLMEVECPK